MYSFPSQIVRDILEVCDIYYGFISCKTLYAKQLHY